MIQKKSASILRKFLLFNLGVFSILGLITIVYLGAIQPNLVKKRATNHYIIINNTVDHLQRLNINFNAKDIRTFLLSTRFLFQSLDRVQFYSINGDLIGDTNILDLDQNVFTRSDIIIEETIDGQIKEKGNSKKLIKEQNKNLIKEAILNKYQNEPITISENIQNNFFVSTLSRIKLNKKDAGYIVVSEEANDILNAVKERKAFITRTVLAVTLVILIFSLFLNKYILKPISLLVRFSEAINEAGGLQKYADLDRAVLIRANKSTNIFIKEFLLYGDVKNNPYLTDGDKIFVPFKGINSEQQKKYMEYDNANKVLVTGFVIKPTAHYFRPGYSAKDYIALSGGSLDVGASKRVRILKKDGRILKKAYNETIEPGDIVDIPETYGSIIFGNTGFVQALTSIATLMLAYQATLR